MNILLLTTSWNPPVTGGVKALAHTLVSELVAQHTVTVFVASWNHRSPVQTVGEGGVPVIERRLTAPVGTGNPFRAFIGWLLDLSAFLRQFRRICRERKIDVIHINQGNPSWFNVALAAFTGIPPYTVGLHGGEVREYAVAGFFARRCFDLILRNSAAVVAVSNALATRAKELVAASAEKIVEIPNGVRDVAIGGSGNDAWGDDNEQQLPEVFFLSVGSLLHVKGHDVAIRAWRYVLEQCPECHLIIVGDGDRRSHLERLIEECECQSRIHLLGTETPGAVRRLMSRARGLVQPSRYESLGIVLLEAGITGCPVVATRVGGIPEVVEHEKTGLLVDSEDEPGLAAAVLRLLADRTFAEHLAANLSCRVRSKFTASAMAEKYAAVFAQVMRDRG